MRTDWVNAPLRSQTAWDFGGLRFTGYTCLHAISGLREQQ